MGSQGIRGPQKLREGVHHLLSKDPTTDTGVCAICGPTPLERRRKKNPNHNDSWACVGKARELSRRNRLKKYGLTPDQYDAMHERQGGRCAVCSGENYDGRALAVDHDHTTGEVRDLLCVKCNASLGQVNDSISRLEGLIAYLRKHGKT